MTTVACVLRSGGDFDERWVRALSRGVFRHLPWAPFVCLSDVPVPGIRTIPLRHRWPGFWAKIELLNLSGHVLAMDLDTLPTGSLSEIAAYAGEFALIRDLNPRVRARQSGVMAFRGGPGTIARGLYERFAADPDRWMRAYRGDGEWLNEFAPRDVDILQDMFLGQVVSLKFHAVNGPPPGARLVCGHGRPRFTSPAAGWAHLRWRNTLSPMSVAVVIPVGPGHEGLSALAVASVFRAWEFSPGPFRELTVARVLDTEGALGRSAARNRGMDQNPAAFHFLLDADDETAREAFTLVATDSPATFGAISLNGTVTRGNRFPLTRSDLFRHGARGTLSMGCFLHGDLGLRFNESLDVAEDFDFYMRIPAFTKQPKPLVHIGYDKPSAGGPPGFRAIPVDRSRGCCHR